MEDDEYEEVCAASEIDPGVFEDFAIDGALENADVSWARAQNFLQRLKVTDSTCRRHLTQNKTQSGTQVSVDTSRRSDAGERKREAHIRRLVALSSTV